MGVTQVASEEDFTNQLSAAGDKLVVVDFFADWCGPCRKIAPVLMEWSKTEFADSVVFLKVNVDELEDLAKEQEISAMPTFLLFKNGKKIETVVGANEAGLKSKIDQHK